MLCTNPFVEGNTVHGCGQCMPCRVQRRRLWCHRLMLESLMHGDSAFVTLTYSEENVRYSSAGLCTLDSTDPQKWLKRIRLAVSPVRLRFYLVGEYGDATWRPHYHAALFGFKPCVFGYSGLAPRQPCVCVSCRLVSDTWGLGFSSVGKLELQSAQYLAGYVTKKMTRRDDVRLQGRLPEFARMSLRPGIGAGAVPEIAKVHVAHNVVERLGDVAAGLRHGSRVMPLGRYLRRKLRSELGVAQGAKGTFLDEKEKEVLGMRLSLRDDPENFSLKKALVERDRGKVAQMVARSKIWKGKKSL